MNTTYRKTRLQCWPQCMTNKFWELTARKTPSLYLLSLSLSTFLFVLAWLICSLQRYHDLPSKSKSGSLDSERIRQKGHLIFLLAEMTVAGTFHQLKLANLADGP